MRLPPRKEHFEAKAAKLEAEKKGLAYLGKTHEEYQEVIRRQAETIKQAVDAFTKEKRAEMLASAVRATGGHSKAAVARAVGVTTPTIYRWIKEHEDNQKAHRRTHARETE